VQLPSASPTSSPSTRHAFDPFSTPVCTPRFRFMSPSHATAVWRKRLGRYHISPLDVICSASSPSCSTPVIFHEGAKGKYARRHAIPRPPLPRQPPRLTVGFHPLCLPGSVTSLSSPRRSDRQISYGTLGTYPFPLRRRFFLFVKSKPLWLGPLLPQISREYFTIQHAFLVSIHPLAVASTAPFSPPVHRRFSL